uniref:Bacteriophage T5 Orf172 DNA-binding domain-containing protein n=1 Tax=viral metagenome TaxID=1070528 RepID=A0A6C0H3E4_9ZZZZ
MLKRRRRGVYEIGNVVYIMSHVAFTTYYQDDYYKIGISTQSMTETTPAFKIRLASYKQGAPCEYKVHYLIYVENNKLIEDILKLKFKDQLNPSNGEWIKGVKLEEIIKSIRYLCDYIGLPCKEHSIMKHKNIVNDGKVLDYEDEEETELLSDKCVERDKESSIEFIETDEENTYSDQEDDGEREVKQVEMIEEIEKYDAKQLTEMLLQFKLPVSGNKDAKKTRIRQYAEKNKIIVNAYISNVMETEKQTFCIDCGVEISYKAARCDPCSRKSSRVVIERPDYETLKKQYEDCGKNMRKLAMIHNVSDKAVAKWFDKYEKELCVTKSCRKKIKPKSTILKPSDKDLLHDRNVLKLNFTELGKKYNVDRTTARDWLSTL